MKKRLIAVLLAAAFVLVAAPWAFAFGTADGTMAITHINEANRYEGAGIIIDGAKYERIGDLGNYAWWNVLLFDWDEEQECYVLTEKNLNSNNVDKSAMAIPRTGFAYGACIGNDYSSSGGINYLQTTKMKDSIDLAKTLRVGDKAYLYGVNLAKGQIKNNGKQWYSTDYVTESYIKMGEPEPGKEPYRPGDADKPMQYVIRPNHVNSTHYESGDCNLFDNRNSLRNEVSLNYSWWTCLVFGWDAEKQSYVCVANDKSTGNGMEKTPPIPEGGFVILDCYSENAASIAACLTGTEAWLYSEGGSPVVYLNERPEGGTEIKPDLAGLPAAEVSGAENGVLQLSEDQRTVSWNAVPGANEYLISVNLSSIHTFGNPVLHPTRVAGTSYTFPAGTISPGQKYTVFLQALASGKASLTSAATLACVYDSALTSSLREKTVVAFGDSLTARPGWVNMLSGFIGTEVVNAGVGGDSTNNGMARFQKDVLDLDPDVVLICFGMNDQAQVLSGNRPNISLETYRRNMESFADRLAEAGADVVFICPHDVCTANGYYSPGSYGLDYGYGNMKDFAAAVRQIALEKGLDFIDIYEESQSEDLTKFLVYGDGIHQSAYGHEKWAEYVSEYLLAKYDGTNRFDVSVVCEDSSGNSLKEYGFTAAKGAAMRIPAAEIEGMELLDAERSVKAGETNVVRYRYRAASEWKRGDVNGDGKVNGSDYLMLKRYILKTLATAVTPEMLARMDVNGDNVTNAKDYQITKRIVLGTYTG
ncbi:MAG: hypothetical protein ILO68_00180 [Clostridia bacterium]|nr:hypothetical protein [Clostridia bacterium]